MSEEKQLMTMIESALALHEIGKNKFQSKQLWSPVGGRGVFGGQVVALALSAATKTVDSSFQVHSLHSYFLLPGDSSIPIKYEVFHIRTGKSYATRAVRATQNGKVIFICSCSFQIPEKSEFEHQYDMPEVPPPEFVPSSKENLTSWLQHAPKKFHKLIQMRLEEPLPIEIRPLRYMNMSLNDFIEPHKEIPKQYVWMRAKGKLPDDLAFHHCVATYISDHFLLSTSLLPHGITAFSNPRLQMIASLDHTLWFHGPFRADEWLLFEMESSRTVGGRGLTFGRIYTQQGKLVMSCAQEGVIRASRIEVKDLNSKL